MKPSFAGFPPETLDFFRQLKRNNNRDWFLANKHIYEKKVKAPMVQFIEVLKEHLRKPAPDLRVDPEKSIFRIYRDVRFSANKDPYKTHIAAYFPSRKVEHREGAGLYFHLDAEEVMLGGGLYHPAPDELRAVRLHIAENPRKLRKIIGQGQFKKHFGTLKGEKLIRIPKGFPEDHPAADLLRYKEYVVIVTRPPELATSSQLLPTVLHLFEGMIPLVRYLNEALLQPVKRFF